MGGFGHILAIAKTLKSVLTNNLHSDTSLATLTMSGNIQKEENVVGAMLLDSDLHMQPSRLVVFSDGKNTHRRPYLLNETTFFKTSFVFGYKNDVISGNNITS
jgi:hypothetical protein